jgi:predicted ABC-type ATPase
MAIFILKIFKKEKAPLFEGPWFIIALNFIYIQMSLLSVFKIKIEVKKGGKIIVYEIHLCLVSGLQKYAIF